jgi:hypothetical protein
VKSNHRVPGRTPGRPHRSQHEIDAILGRHRLSGLSLLAFAREHDLCYATLLRWRRRAVDRGNVQTPTPVSTPTFIPIELEPAAAGAEFVLNWAPNRSLRIPPGFDAAELRRLLDVLGVRS